MAAVHRPRLFLAEEFCVVLILLQTPEQFGQLVQGVVCVPGKRPVGAAADEGKACLDAAFLSDGQK